MAIKTKPTHIVHHLCPWMGGSVIATQPADQQCHSRMDSHSPNAVVHRVKGVVGCRASFMLKWDPDGCLVPHSGNFAAGSLGGVECK